MRRVVTTLGLTGVLVAAVALSGPAVARPTTMPTGVASSAAARPTTVGRFHAIPLPGRRSLGWRPLGTAAGTFTTATVILSGAPVASQVARSRAIGRPMDAKSRESARRAVADRQVPVIARIRATGVQVLFTLQSAVDAIVVRGTRAQLAALAAVTGVMDVQLSRRVTRSNSNSNAFTGVGSAWESTGFTGIGQRIAVIDTGIDYTHADFGGPGTTAAYSTNDRTLIEAGTFPTSKVVAGYDFVGDSYDAASGDPAALVPRPDPDPLPCNDHGTHVAGTAAGSGVNTDGSTYSGPYSAAAVAGLKIAPGAAPGASLLAYKVFGCDGAVDDAIVVAAIDRAVVDGATIINMSLGSDYGSARDAQSMAIDNASAAGVLVVAAAGNAGPMPYLVGGPSTADRAVSVAAVDGVPTFTGARISVGATSFDAIDANESGVSSLAARAVVLSDGAEGIGTGCADSDYAGTSGRVVIVLRGGCPRVDKAFSGQAAGAVAVVMVNTADGLPPAEGRVPGLSIPFIGVGGSAGAVLAAADGTTITLTSTGPLANPTYREVASFSSGGPRSGDSATKPDLAAPGVSVRSAAMGTGNDGESLSGTSMATPHVSGIAALVRSAHPLWTPAQVKSALMSTSTDTNLTSFDVRAVGAGVVSAPAAVSASVVAGTDDGTQSLSFGYQPAAGALDLRRSFTIENLGASPVTYALSVRTLDPMLGADITVSPSIVTLAAGERRSVEARLTMSATAVAALPGASTSVVTPDGLTTLRGIIVATPTGSRPQVAGAMAPNAIRIPFLVVPRGLSALSASDAQLLDRSKPALGRVVTVTNRGNHSGTADFYAWQAADRSGDAPREVDVVSAGIQSLPVPNGAAPPRDALQVIAVNFSGTRSTAASKELDILIDTNRDGAPEFLVVGIDNGLVFAGEPDGTWASLVIDLRTFTLVDAWKGEAPFNGSVVQLPFLASDLGLAPGASTFRYAIQSWDLLGNGYDLVSGWSTWDALQPPVATGQFVGVAPGGVVKVPVGDFTGPAIRVDRHRGEAKVSGYLVVVLDNPNGSAQALTVRQGESGK